MIQFWFISFEPLNPNLQQNVWHVEKCWDWEKLHQLLIWGNIWKGCTKFMYLWLLKNLAQINCEFVPINLGSFPKKIVLALLTGFKLVDLTGMFNKCLLYEVTVLLNSKLLRFVIVIYEEIERVCILVPFVWMWNRTKLSLNDSWELWSLSFGQDRWSFSYWWRCSGSPF